MLNLNSDHNSDLQPGFRTPLITVILFITVISVLPLLTAQAYSAGSFLNCITAAALFTFLYNATGYKWLCVMIIPPYLAAFLTTRDPVASLEFISFAPAGTLFIYAIKKKANFTGTVAAISAGLTVLYPVFILIAVISEYGALNAGVLTSFGNVWSQSVKDALAGITVQVSGADVKLYSAGEINRIVNELAPRIPGLLITIMNITAFFSVVIYRGLTKLFGVSGLKKFIPAAARHFELSIISAYVYCAAYVFSVFGGNKITGVFTAAAANVILILTPGSALMGLKYITVRFKKRRSIKTAAVYGVIVLTLLLLNPSFVITGLSFTGVIETIISRHTINKSVK